MSLSAGPQKGGGPVADINVTPMADVMIVLLIIFMVATPVLTGSLRLPVADHARDAARGALVVVVKPDRSLAVEGSLAADLGAVSTEVRERLDSMLEGSRVVYLKADGDLPYTDVLLVIDLVRELGADQVAFMARPRTGA